MKIAAKGSFGTYVQEDQPRIAIATLSNVPPFFRQPVSRRRDNAMQQRFQPLAKEQIQTNEAKDIH